MNTKSRHKLVFVYNADSGLFNTVTDVAHKIISPRTYSCDLCSLTHGYFKVRDTWVKFLQAIDVECEFLHRDQLFEKYAIADVELPQIYKNINGKLESWISKNEIEPLSSVDELVAFIKQKLAETK